jgi:hypothetical protein
MVRLTDDRYAPRPFSCASVLYCAPKIVYKYFEYVLAQFENSERTPNLVGRVVARCFHCACTAFRLNLCHSNSDGIRDGEFQMWALSLSLSLSLFLFKVPQGYELVFELSLKYNRQKDVSPSQSAAVKERGQKDHWKDHSDQQCTNTVICVHAVSVLCVCSRAAGRFWR